MSDEIIDELTEFAEKQAAERLEQSDIAEMAQKFGLGNADELVGRAAGLFGLHTHNVEHERAVTPSDEGDESDSQGEPAENESQDEGDEDQQ